MPFRPKVSGNWTIPKSIYAKHSGSWKLADRIYVKDAGEWKLAGVRSGNVWTKHDTAADYQQWKGVCYGKGLFVAVGPTGATSRIMTSPDGKDWTLRTTPTPLYKWISVTYSPDLDRFLAVAEDTFAGYFLTMTSTDGISWSMGSAAITAGVYYSPRYVIYANGRFVVYGFVGGNMQVATSEDGDSWTLGDNLGSSIDPGDHAFRRISYTNGKLFLSIKGFAYSTLLYSEDGIDWGTAVTSDGFSYGGSNVDFLDVKYVNGKYVVLGRSKPTFSTTYEYYIIYTATDITDLDTFVIRSVHNARLTTTGANRSAYYFLLDGDGILAALPYSISTATDAAQIAISRDGGENWSFEIIDQTGWFPHFFDGVYADGKFVGVCGEYLSVSSAPSSPYKALVSEATW